MMRRILTMIIVPCTLALILGSGGVSSKAVAQDDTDQASPAAGAPTSGQTPERPAQEGASENPSDAEQQPQPAGEQQSATAQSVQGEVNKATEEKKSQEIDSLVKEAVSAVDLTRKALGLLEQGKKEEALETLAQVAGKLELAIARNPGLAFLPVDVATTVYDVIASIDTVEEYVDAAEEALDDGRIQEARRILSGLASEVVISTTKLPVATYPEAIKKVAPLIDQGEIDQAKEQLRTALNLLVVSDAVYPLPVLRSNAMLAEAESLAEKKARTAEENERLEKLLAETEHQVSLGRVLGYMDKKRAGAMLDELQRIRERTAGGKSGKGFFTQIKELFSGWEDWEDWLK